MSCATLNMTRRLVSFDCIELDLAKVSILDHSNLLCDRVIDDIILILDELPSAADTFWLDRTDKAVLLLRDRIIDSLVV